MPRIHSCTVTPAILATATKTLDEVRAAIRQLIAGGDAVLVGHSLECDLHAMRLSLPDGAGVLDTALLYPLRCNLHGPPAKAALRNLTVQHLKREIQQPRMEPGVMNVGMGHSPAEGMGHSPNVGMGHSPATLGPSGHSGMGHSPAEDAQAAMDLAVLKLANGHSYATPDASWGIGFERMDTVRLPHESTDLAQARMLMWPIRTRFSCCVQVLARTGWHSLTIDTAEAILAMPPSPASSVEVNQMVIADDEAAVQAAVHALSGTLRTFAWLGLHGVRSVAPLEALVAALPANRLVVVVGIDVREQASRDGMPSAEEQPGVPTGSRPVRSPNGWVTLTVTGNGGSCGSCGASSSTASHGTAAKH